METINENPSFEDYLKKVIRISEDNPREINYQLEIVKPLLEKLLSGHQIPDTSQNSNDTARHTREHYTLPGHTAPDLLIAKEYQYDNNSDEAPKTEIIAAIEIKTPYSDEMTGDDLNNYKIHLLYELALYIYKDSQVIATNCRRWQFFRKANNESFDESVPPILERYNKNKNKKPDNSDFQELIKQLKPCHVKTIDVLPNKGVIKAEDYCTAEEPDEFTKNLICLQAQRFIKPPKAWYELIEYIPKFINTNPTEEICS